MRVFLIYNRTNNKYNSSPIKACIVISILICLIVFNNCSASKKNYFTQYTLTIYSDTTMPVNENTFVGAGIYNAGTKVNIRANPELGWDFVEWTGDIETVVSRFSSNTDIVMKSNYEIKAHFTYPVIIHNISNVVFDPETPNQLNFGEKVKISFDYCTNDKTAVYIFIHPFSGGNILSNYLFDGGRIYHPWQSKGEVGFTFKLQPDIVIVDQLRFRIMNIVQTEIIYEFFVPINYTFQ